MANATHFLRLPRRIATLQLMDMAVSASDWTILQDSLSDEPQAVSRHIFKTRRLDSSAICAPLYGGQATNRVKDREGSYRRADHNWYHIRSMMKSITCRVHPCLDRANTTAYMHVPSASHAICSISRRWIHIRDTAQERKAEQGLVCRRRKVTSSLSLAHQTGESQPP